MGLVEADEDVTGDSLSGSVDLDLNYPLYDVRNECSMDNDLHDIFTTEDMSDFVNLARHEVATGLPEMFLLLDAVSRMVEKGELYGGSRAEF